MVSNSHRCLILGNKVLIVIVLSTLLGLLSACTGSDSPYDSVEHFGKENIVRTSLVFDTLRLDALYIPFRTVAHEGQPLVFRR